MSNLFNLIKGIIFERVVPKELHQLDNYVCLLMNPLRILSNFHLTNRHFNLFSFRTSLTCLGVAGFIGYKYFFESGYDPSKKVYYGEKLSDEQSEVLYFLFGFVAMCLSLRVMLHRYPLRIYKNSDK